MWSGRLDILLIWSLYSLSCFLSRLHLVINFNKLCSRNSWFLSRCACFVVLYHSRFDAGIFAKYTRTNCSWPISFVGLLQIFKVKSTFYSIVNEVPLHVYFTSFVLSTIRAKGQSKFFRLSPQLMVLKEITSINISAYVRGEATTDVFCAYLE